MYNIRKFRSGYRVYHNDKPITKMMTREAAITLLQELMLKEFNEMIQDGFTNYLQLPKPIKF